MRHDFVPNLWRKAIEKLFCMCSTEGARGAMPRWLGLVGLAAAVLGACATGAALEREGEALEAHLNAAREAGAYRCAPVALAKSEAHLEFLRSELQKGDARRAAQHRKTAADALAVVVEQTQECPPLDRDQDTVPDADDQCPDTVGKVELAGCPDKDDDGVRDVDDKCPDAPEDIDGIEDEDGCPEVEDQDGDGIIDGDDPCPKDPEDVDGFEDHDGCPDLDNDNDGVADAEDQCPQKPETKNGFEDEDGCPDTKYQLVEVNRELGKIEIKQKVFFATGKTRVKAVSFAVLNEVADVLRENPSMKVVVEGHTDSVGSHRTNQRLSQRRADAVRTYILEKGIDPGRLTAVGFGEDQPIDTNRTRSGRERNRRVEFTIVPQ